MAVAKQKSAKDLKKKKKWVPIFVNKEFFNGVEIGETYVSEPELCLGKTLSVNLMNLTRDSRKHGNINVKFKILNYTNNQLFAELISLNLQVAQLKRTTRANKDKIEDSFIVKCKDNTQVAVKPIMLTKAEANNSILTALRHATRKFTSEFAKNTSYPQFMNEVISGNLQKEIRNAVKKVYPITSCNLKAVVKQ